MNAGEIVRESLRNWIPTKLIPGKDNMRSTWLYTGNKSYNTPFFDEARQRFLSLAENSKGIGCTTSVELITEWAPLLDTIPPTAFIFHVSRCGSTLISQTLGMDVNTISVSEVPLYDEILRIPLSGRGGYVSDINQLYKSAVAFYGTRRTGNENRFYIKTDSWHLMFFDQLRAMYPATPFIIVYRKPGEVLESNRRRPGVQGVPGLVEPSLYNFNDDEQKALAHPDSYMEVVLERFFEQIIEIAGKDTKTLLLNYNIGISEMMKRFAEFTGITLSAEDEAKIAERGRYNAKFPGKIFAEENRAAEKLETKRLTSLYEAIEAIAAKH